MTVDRARRRRWSLRISVLAAMGLVSMLSACPALAQPTVPSPEDAAAISAVIDAYYAALNGRQLHGALALWSEKSPELPTVRRTLPFIFERTNPDWTGIEATVLSVAGAKARARVTFSVSYAVPQMGGETRRVPPVANHNVMELVREAGRWRITADRSEVEDLARRLMEAPADAPNDAAVARLVADEREGVTLTVVHTLIGLAAYAAAQAQHDAAIRGYERAVRLAELPVARLSDRERETHAAEAHLATALAGLAQVHVYKPKPDLPTAIALLTRALDLREQIADVYGVSHVMQALANAYYSAGDYAEALARYERVLQLVTEQEDVEAVARTQLGIGNVQFLFGQHDRALTAYRAALDSYTSSQNTGEQARALLGMGRVYAAVGDFKPARAAYEWAFRLFDGRSEKSEQASTLLEIARVSFLQGDLPDARAQDERALAMAQSIDDAYNVGRAHFAIGLLDAIEGGSASLRPVDERSAEAPAAAPRSADGRASAAARPDSSASRTAATAPAAAPGAPPRGDPVLASRAASASAGATGFDRAVVRYTRAIEAFERQTPPNADAIGQVLIARGFVRLEQRDLLHAREDFTASIQTFDRTKNREGLARAHLGLAMTHVRQRDATRALDLVARAREYAERAASPDVLWQAHAEAGRAWRLAGDADKARQAFESAIRVLEGTRFETGGDADMSSPAQRAAPYVAMVEWHLDRRDPAQALIAAEAARRRLLQDLLQPFHFRLTRGLTPERQAAERRLVNQRVSLLKQIRSERDLATPNAERLGGLETSLAAARTAASAWTDALARDVPSLAYQRGDVRLASLEPLASALPASGAVISFTVGDERTSVIVATACADAPASNPASLSNPTPPGPLAPGTSGARGRSGADGLAPGTSGARGCPPVELLAYSVPLARAQLAERVARFAEDIAKRGDADSVTAEARALYTLLLGPAADRLAGRSQITIVPDDSLWALPFEALMPSDDRYLVQEASITAMPSIASWVLGPSGSVASETASNAPGTTTSAERPPQPPQPLIALDATGELSDINPLQTRLTFSSADAQTIPLWELIERDLATDVLVLTGVTPKQEQIRVDAGRLGPTGLFWAAQSAGATRAIAARRPIADDAPTVAAEPLPHPHDWATWLVLGPPQP